MDLGKDGGFLCPFRDCLSKATQHARRKPYKRYSTLDKLVTHIMRCGPRVRCVLCGVEVTDDSRLLYEMQRHRGGGMGETTKTGRRRAKKDERKQCSFIKGCGGNEKDTAAVYAKLVADELLGVIDNKQLGKGTSSLGPRLRRYRDGLAHLIQAS